LVVVLALVGCSADPASHSARPRSEQRPALFEALPSHWHQFDEPVQRIGLCRTVANTLAANWRADRVGSHGWAAEMPRDGIVITVTLIGPPVREHRLRSAYPPVGKAPLRLPATTASSLEGLPDVPEYRVFARTPDYLVEVRADINNPGPGRALVREARSVVRGLRLPDWGERCLSREQRE
jgi:hypothetical protein